MPPLSMPTALPEDDRAVSELAALGLLFATTLILGASLAVFVLVNG